MGWFLERHRGVGFRERIPKQPLWQRVVRPGSPRGRSLWTLLVPGEAATAQQHPPPPAAPLLTVLSCPSLWGRASTSPQRRRPFLSPPAGPSCRQRRLGADTSRGDAAGQPGASPAVTAHSAPCQRPRFGTRRLPTTQPAPSARHVPQPAWCVARVPVSLPHVTEPARRAARVPVSCCPASSSGTGRGFQHSPESPCPKPSLPWHRDPGPAHRGGVGEVRPALTRAFVTSAASVVPGRQETSSPSLEKRR